MLALFFKRVQNKQKRMKTSGFLAGKIATNGDAVDFCAG